MLESEELPLLCIGVKGHSRPTEPTNGQLKFDIIRLDDTPQDKPGTEHMEPVNEPTGPCHLEAQACSPCHFNVVPVESVKSFS